MTTYGTILEEPLEPPNHLFLSLTKQQIQTGLGTKRPWKEMIQRSHIRFPSSFSNSIQRIKTNAHVFCVNYVIIILFILFLSLLWHPISLIIFSVMMVAWLLLYFLRDTPLIVFGYKIDERLVAISLLLVTIGLLFVTSVTDNILVGISIGLAILFVHAVLREAEDQFSMDEEVGITTSGREVIKVPLRQAGSSSFTMS